MRQNISKCLSILNMTPLTLCADLKTTCRSEFNALSGMVEMKAIFPHMVLLATWNRQEKKGFTSKPPGLDTVDMAHKTTKSRWPAILDAGVTHVHDATMSRDRMQACGVLFKKQIDSNGKKRWQPHANQKVFKTGPANDQSKQLVPFRLVWKSSWSPVITTERLRLTWIAAIQSHHCRRASQLVQKQRISTQRSNALHQSSYTLFGWQDSTSAAISNW